MFRIGTPRSQSHPSVPTDLKPAVVAPDFPCQACLLESCAKKRATGVAAHQGIALDCAQSEEVVPATSLKQACAYEVDFAQKATSAAVKRHEKPARTQCLTSAAHRLCPPSDFSCTVDADPKTRFCRPPPATLLPSAGMPPIPLTLRHLCSPPERLARLWFMNVFVPFYSSQDAPYSCGASPEKIGMSRKDAQRLS